MKYVVVIPSIFQPYTDACLASLKLPQENIRIIDNTTNNRGVAASWNIGVDEVLENELDWLVIMSASMRFGDAGCQDFIDQLDPNRSYGMVEAGNDVGWHLVAFHRWVLKAVGKFDENFYPAYFEDNDYSYRFQLLMGRNSKYFPSVGIKVPVDCKVESIAHGIRLAGVDPSHGPRLREYFIDKWGGEPSQEKYEHPFNDTSKSFKWWPKK